MSVGRILLTGGRGFVGRHLGPVLQAAYPDAEIFTPQFDVTDAEAVGAAVSSTAPHAVIHLAAVAAPMEARRNPDHAWSVNLHGTVTLARAVLAQAATATFVFAGSADAYGTSFRGGRPLDETVALAPQNTYGATKAAADLALGAMAAEGLRVVRFRPFNHTGPGQTDAFVVPAFAKQVARVKAGLQPPTLHVGDLTPERDFLDVRDVCAAYAAALNPGLCLEPGVIFNLASGHSRRVGDILRTLLELAGVQAEIATDPARLRPSDIPRALGNPARARDLLGWSPRIPWTQTLQDVLGDWRSRI